MTQRWLIRVASHARHGGGHVSRCGCLARALADAGANVTVQLDPGSPDAMARYLRLGLECREDDVLRTGPWHGSVLDGYDLIDSVARDLSRIASPLVVLDDFLTPPPGTALAVNAAFHLHGDHIGQTPALLGPRYAMIDTGYARLPTNDRTGPVRHILITLGRLDAEGRTGRALDGVEQIAPEAKITVATSVYSPHHMALSERVGALGGRGRLVCDAPDMLDHLGAADFVVGAGGISLMERMAAGVPSMTLRLADNQRLFVEGAARLGATIDGGDPTSDGIATALRPILADGGARAAMAAAGRRTLDGKGAERVAARLMMLSEDGLKQETAIG